MVNHWNNIYLNAPDGAKIHLYETEDNETRLLRAFVEYEMDMFFSSGKVKTFAEKRLEEVKKILMETFKINNDDLEKKVNKFLSVYDGTLPVQNNKYGDWIRENNNWRKQSDKELINDREEGIRYFNKYIKYKTKYIKLKNNF